MSRNNNPKYKEFLTSMAQFGNGIFTITMLDENDRPALKTWTARNSSYFNTFEARRGDVKLHKLTREGYEWLGLKFTKKISTSDSYSNNLDMALVNAFMTENQDFLNYRYKAHFNIDLKCGRVSVLSGSFHIPRGLKKIDFLLCTDERRRLWLKKDIELKEIARREKLSVDELKTILANAIVPKAFQNMRDIESPDEGSSSELVF